MSSSATAASQPRLARLRGATARLSHVVTALLQAGTEQVTVSDDGPGVSAERLASLRQALQRGDLDDAAHDVAVAGLGLALADRVALAHGGRLELPSVAAGFAARLWLVPAPASRPPEAGAGHA